MPYSVTDADFRRLRRIGTAAPEIFPIRPAPMPAPARYTVRSMSASRRNFVKGSLGTTFLSSLAASAVAQKNSANGIPTRRLGRTGEQVLMLCIGGAHLGRAAQDDGEKAGLKLAHAALDNGVFFWDNAYVYLDGYAEEFMGRALKGRRDKVFLMTKNSGRDATLAQKCLETSLRRLQTDYLDLWQFHETNYDNDPDWVFEKGGLKFALEAQKAGKVRYIGFTGHKHPLIHVKMLNKGYDWATAQMPINPMDYFYRSFQREVVPLCAAKDVGVLGMKCLGGGRRAAKIPSETKVTAEMCVRWALSLPIASLVRGYLTMDQLMADVKIARGFKPLQEAERKRIMALAAPEAGDGRHELFKSTQFFDGPLYRKMHGYAVEG